MSKTDQAEAVNPMSAMGAIGQWMTHWSEQQRQWADSFDAFKSGKAPEGPFATLAAAMAAATKGLPRDALGPQAWSALPSMAEALLGRVDSAPTLAPLWDFDRKSAAASAAWWRLQEAQIKYRALLDSAWPSVQKAAAQRQADAAKQKKATSARETFEFWLDALNQVLLELMRTPDYLKAQRETLDAGLAFRETMATIAAEVCEWLQLPAREDVDDLARSLTDLRREVRALQRPSQARARTAAIEPKATPRKQPRTGARRVTTDRAGKRP
jgi:hypothetical protein